MLFCCVAGIRKLIALFYNLFRFAYILLSSDSDILQICLYKTKKQANMHSYIQAYIHTYINTYVHTYILTCMHTYIKHTCILSQQIC